MPAGSPILPGRIEFVFFLRMDRSPPAVPHPASRRRSCIWFQAGEGNSSKLAEELFTAPRRVVLTGAGANLAFWWSQPFVGLILDESYFRAQSWQQIPASMAIRVLRLGQNEKPQEFQVDLGSSTQVTTFNPRWSPDGRKMLFTAATSTYQLLPSRSANTRPPPRSIDFTSRLCSGSLPFPA